MLQDSLGMLDSTVNASLISCCADMHGLQSLAKSSMVAPPQSSIPWAHTLSYSKAQPPMQDLYLCKRLSFAIETEICLTGQSTTHSEAHWVKVCMCKSKSLLTMCLCSGQCRSTCAAALPSSHTWVCSKAISARQSHGALRHMTKPHTTPT